MYHKVRITVVSLVTMAICVLSSVGTLSYFTDTDAAINNFLVGNASTELVIYDDVTGDNRHELDASEEKYTLTPNLQIPFYLQAENTGNIPVYQRFRVVIPIALRGKVTLNLPDCEIDTSITSGTDVCDTTNYNVIYKPAVSVDNVDRYAEYYIVSNNVLAKGAKTAEWPTAKLLIGDIVGLEDLFVCPGADTSGNNCTLGISAYSDAIQTTGFTSAIQAFESFNETY